MMAAFRSRIASAKAFDRPYDYDDVAATIETLAALCEWVTRLEGAATRASSRASSRGNLSAAHLLDATANYVGGDSITQELVVEIAMIGREIRSQRTKEGLARARAAGRRLGRQRAYRPEMVHAAEKLMAGGMSQRRTAKELNVPSATLRRYLKAR
jgi:hypothetical protein